jgi:flagellar basal-body rod protein FlgC
VYDPSHPDADARGFVSYPGVNPVSEMVNLIDITRAYEANVRAFNAGRNMLLKALEIGSGR